MKTEIHPAYRPVVFMDAAADFSFLTKSTIETEETIEWTDGNTYPLSQGRDLIGQSSVLHRSDEDR